MYYPFINERNYVYINFCNIIILYFIIQFVRALLVLQKDIEEKISNYNFRIFTGYPSAFPIYISVNTPTFLIQKR